MNTATTQQNTNKLLRDVLAEVRSLRKEVSLFVPQETLSDYKNVPTIKRTLAKARAQYPAYDGHRD
jgi:hypothetical protein